MTVITFHIQSSRLCDKWTMYEWTQLANPGNTL